MRTSTSGGVVRERRTPYEYEFESVPLPARVSRESEIYGVLDALKVGAEAVRVNRGQAALRACIRPVQEAPRA